MSVALKLFLNYYCEFHFYQSNPLAILLFQSDFLGTFYNTDYIK